MTTTTEEEGVFESEEPSTNEVRVDASAHPVARPEQTEATSGGGLDSLPFGRGEGTDPVKDRIRRLEQRQRDFERFFNTVREIQRTVQTLEQNQNALAAKVASLEAQLQSQEGLSKDDVREEHLVEMTKEKHEGEGYVAVDKRTGEMIASSSSSIELNQRLLDMDYDPSETLIINC